MELYCQECKKYHELDQQQVQRVMAHANEKCISGMCIDVLAWTTPITHLAIARNDRVIGVRTMVEIIRSPRPRQG